LGTKFEPDHAPGFDPELAQDLIGSTLLVGVTYLRGETLLRQEQFFGTVAGCSLEEGLTLKLDDGATMDFPPMIEWLQPAPPGEYRMRATGKIVVNPDYLLQLTSTLPGHEA
jgi:hypothetical protein